MAFNWVSKDFGGIKDITQSQVGITGFNDYPFADIKVRESYSWGTYNSGKYGTHQSLDLNDIDIFRAKSGAAHYRAAPNFRIRMLVYTDNWDYMDDYIKKPSLVEDYGNAVGDSFVVFTLDGNTEDYVSVDIDQEHSGIAAFNLRINNEWAFKDSPKINDEVKIVVLGVQQYEYVPDVEVEGPMEEGGQGDLDQDGVIDAEDFAPNDPAVQEEEDVPIPEDPTQDQNQDNGGGGGGDGDIDSTDEDDRSILWLVAIGVVVLIALGVVALPRRKGD